MKIKPKKIHLIKRDNINVAPRRIIVGYNLYKVVTFYVKLYDIFFSLNGHFCAIKGYRSGSWKLTLKRPLGNKSHQSETTKQYRDIFTSKIR